MPGVIVIGGGASGMAAALFAARGGASVTLYLRQRPLQSDQRLQPGRFSLSGAEESPLPLRRPALFFTAGYDGAGGKRGLSRRCTAGPPGFSLFGKSQRCHQSPPVPDAFFRRGNPPEYSRSRVGNRKWKNHRGADCRWGADSGGCFYPLHRRLQLSCNRFHRGWIPAGFRSRPYGTVSLACTGRAGNR